MRNIAGYTNNFSSCNSFVHAVFFWSSLALLLGSFAPYCLAWEAEVLHVHDGDSLIVRRLPFGKKVRVRLQGIDAPEMKTDNWPPQPYCIRSRDFARSLMPVGITVTLQVLGKDQYDRTLAGNVVLPDGRSVQEEMIKAGMAWVYTRYCRDCKNLRVLEQSAKEERRGLWRELDSKRKPVAPWRWRQISKW